MRWRTGRKGPCTRQADSLVMETDIRLTVRLASPSLDTVPEQPCQPRALSPEQIQNAFINTLDHKDNEERAQQFSAPRPRSRPGQARLGEHLVPGEPRRPPPTASPLLQTQINKACGPSQCTAWGRMGESLSVRLSKPKGPLEIFHSINIPY